MIDRVEERVEAAERALEHRKLATARRLFEEAARKGADPDRCDGGRWMAAMLGGDFEAAWQASDRIAARRQEDPPRFWRGENLEGKSVMLRCLHGFGDAVQLLRFVPALRPRASALLVEVDPAVVDLVPWIDGFEGVEVITWGERAPVEPPAWEVQVEINEVMHLLRVGAADVARGPYLKPPKGWIERYAPKPCDVQSLKVGVVWSAGSWNPSRSIPFAAFSELLRVPGCEFWNLQGGKARGQWMCVDRGHPAEECAASVRALAALIAGLDLVVTCDTFAAHLAGAQGVPCWVLLQEAADWRWMHGREDSPWYTSLRLFRREAGEDWLGLVRRVGAQIAALVSA